MTDVRSINPKDAWALLESKPQAVLVDVRSSMEFLFVGHPKGAISVPWIDEPDWKVNPNFAREVRQLMLGGAVCDDDGCVPVMLICRSGKRSLEAGKCLTDDGFQEVYNVEGGFEGPLDDMHHRSSLSGWRFDDLPWEQC